MEYVLINENDNVKVSLSDGHKYAVKNIATGDKIIKYGYPIGVATNNIKTGEKVHNNNLKTSLSGFLDYYYTPEFDEPSFIDPLTISAYIRKDGNIGIRNDVWIIPTVGCVNGIATTLSKKTGALCFTHPYGCSQLGDDLSITQKIISGLVKHPNAGGVLVVGLGCENNNINEFKKVLDKWDDERIRFINCQDFEDEILEGIKIISELKNIAEKDRREKVSISKLKIGLKCGGSDGLSGITANPMCGRISDRIISMGGTAVLTEVPEMFGAEQILMNRCINVEVFCDTVQLINNYKEYFLNKGQPISENPSPGNREGGITTLEEKSLGCIQKGGKSPVTAVLNYGDIAGKPGLNLLNGPGNDMVAVTNLTAAGCQLILFTTGRGTPLGAPVPTIKIATNSGIANKKANWIDFDSQKDSELELFDLIVDTINGQETKNEKNGFREISIFKDGVTL